MKRVYFLIIIILQGLTAQCQTKNDSVKRRGFSLEPISGLGTSEAVQNGNNNLGWKAGCGLVYMFNEHWGISSGLQVEQYATSINSGYALGWVSPGTAFESAAGSNQEIDNINVSYKFTYLEVPLLFRYISSKDRKVGIFAEVGFIGDFLLSGRERDTIYTCWVDTDRKGIGDYLVPNGNGVFTNIVNAPTNISTVIPNTTILVLQWHWALGLHIPLSRHCSLIIEISDNIGLTNVGNSGKDYYTFDIGKLYYYKDTPNSIAQVPNSLYYNTYANPLTPININYGTNSSFLFNMRLNIKI